MLPSRFVTATVYLIQRISIHGVAMATLPLNVHEVICFDEGVRSAINSTNHFIDFEFNSVLCNHRDPDALLSSCGIGTS